MAFQTILIDPAKEILIRIGNVLSSLVLILFILILGWIVAKAVKALVIKLLNLIKIEEISKQIKAGELLAKGGIKYSLSELIGVLCYWVMILVALVVAVNAVGLTVAADLLNRIILYIPNIMAAIFIMVLGLFVSTFLSSIVQTAASNAGINQAKLLSKAVEVLVIVFAIAITLEQLNIGTKTIGFAINIILASIGLAFALAFGLGCKDMTAKMLSDWLDKVKPKK